MKRLFNRQFEILIMLMLVLTCSKAQVVIMTEDFESSAFKSGYGLISATTAKNGWYQSSTTLEYVGNHYSCESGTGVGTHDCGLNCGGCYRHVWTVSNKDHNITGYSAGICGWYSDGVNDGPYGTMFTIFKGLASDRYIYKQMNFTLWKNIKLAFKWKCGGEMVEGLGNDFGGVYLINTSTILHTFTSARTKTSKFAGTETAVLDTLTFPALANGTNDLFLAFNYECNNDNVSYPPTFVIDDIVMTACPNKNPIISSNQTIAIGGSAVLTRDNFYQDYTSAGIVYQWQKSTDNLNWTNVSGTTSLNTGALYHTAYYRCALACGTECDTLFSNMVTITVPECSTRQIGAPIASTADLCNGDPITLSLNTILAGSNCGVWEYAWYNDSTKLYWNGVAYVSAVP